MPKKKNWKQPCLFIWADMTKHRRLFEALQRHCEAFNLKAADVVLDALEAYEPISDEMLKARPVRKGGVEPTVLPQE